MLDRQVHELPDIYRPIPELERRGKLIVGLRSEFHQDAQEVADGFGYGVNVTVKSVTQFSMPAIAA